MIIWDAEKLTKMIGDDVVSRLHLSDNSRKSLRGVERLEYFGRHFDLGFFEEKHVHDSEKFFLISVYFDDEKFMRYLIEDVSTEKIFSKWEPLSAKSSKRGFSKYKERIPFHSAKGITIDENPETNIIYRVNGSLLKLNRNGFKTSVFDYALSPVLYWIREHRVR